MDPDAELRQVRAASHLRKVWPLIVGGLLLLALSFAGMGLVVLEKYVAGLSMWLVCQPAAVLCFRGANRLLARAKPGLCPNCLYPVSTGECPECGLRLS